MARKPVSMRQIKEVLRLKHAHQLSIREIARSCGLPSSTVNDYLARAQAAGLSWPLPEALDDQQIQQQLLSASQAPPEASPPAEPMTVMPLALAICTTAEPTAPAAADTNTMSPALASAT